MAGICTNTRGEKIYKLLDFELAIRQDWIMTGGKFDVKAPLRLAGAKTRFMSPELYEADEFQTKIEIGPQSDLWCVLPP